VLGEVGDGIPLYWLCIFAAPIFPETAFSDPEFASGNPSPMGVLRSSSLASWMTWKDLLIILIKKSVQVATIVRDQNWHCFPIGNMQGIMGTAAGFSPGRAHVDVDVLGILDAGLNEVMSSADRSPIIMNRP
jgi:hypothetical protein